MKFTGHWLVLLVCPQENQIPKIKDYQKILPDVTSQTLKIWLFGNFKYFFLNFFGGSPQMGATRKNDHPHDCLWLPPLILKLPSSAKPQLC